MVSMLACWFLAPVAHAEDPAPAAGADIAAALEQPKKAKWDPKGKTIDPYGRGDAKRKQEAWGDAIPLLVESLDVQPGCGKCLNSLSLTLTGAKRYDEAARVGDLMTVLYPERNEGWKRISDAWSEAQEYEKSIDAATKFLEIEKADSNMWWRRNRLLIQLARFEDAMTWIAGADAAGLAKEDAACLKVQVLAATQKPVEARELWPICEAGSNADLERYSEGWIALAEGDSELAAKKLVIAGADDFARLTIAFLRIDQGKFDMAHNLVGKLLEDGTNDWALDAHLAAAESLKGLGKTAEAAAELDKFLMGDGWTEKHAALTVQQLLLKPKGDAWAKEVGRRAATLKVALLAASGDTVAAGMLRDQVAQVYGDNPALTAALDTPIGTTGVGRPQIAEQLATAKTALDKCFAKEKKKNPKLTGQVVVGFSIGADGVVANPVAKSSTLSAAPELEKCTLTEVGKLKFTVATGAQPAEVVFPVNYPL